MLFTIKTEKTYFTEAILLKDICCVPTDNYATEWHSTNLILCVINMSHPCPAVGYVKLFVKFLHSCK